MKLQPVEGKLPLTDECRHYYDISEVPGDLRKYWQQRYSIFNFYDYDIRLTNDAWFGVTPEPVATKIAEDMPWHRHSTPPRDTVVDLFAGAGGNAIAFALSGRWERVVAVERDAATLACAQHNAAVYGVLPGAITWVLGDSFAYLALLKRSAEAGGEEGETNAEAEKRREKGRGRRRRRRSSEFDAADADTAAAAGRGRGGGGGGGGGTSLEAEAEVETGAGVLGLNPDAELELDPSLRLDPARTVLFASPPWGGVSYRDHEVFDLSTMRPYNLATLHEACRPMAHALYLPRTSDLRQIAALVPSGGGRKAEVVQYCMEGASKAMVAYMPAE